MSSPTESKTDRPEVKAAFRIMLTNGFGMAILTMPSQKPGADMSLAVKVASHETAALYAETYSFEALCALCPLIGAVPGTILTILKKTPRLEFRPNSNAARIEYGFSMYIAEKSGVSSKDSIDKQQTAAYQCVMGINIGEVNICSMTQLRSDLEEYRAKYATSESELQAARKTADEIRALTKERDALIAEQNKDSSESHAVQILGLTHELECAQKQIEALQAAGKHARLEAERLVRSNADLSARLTEALDKSTVHDAAVATNANQPKRVRKNGSD